MMIANAKVQLLAACRSVEAKKNVRETRGMGSDLWLLGLFEEVGYRAE